MSIARLEVTFVLHGCVSLKDKRRRLARLRDKFGKQTAIGVCESAFADSLQQAQWTFVACASNAKVVEQILTEIETYVATSVDGEITVMQRDWLA